MQGEYLAANGMTHLMKTVEKVHRQINTELKVAGIVLTLVDKRTNLAIDVKEQLEKNYGKLIKIFKTEIPKAIASSRSTATGKSIFEFVEDPDAKATSPEYKSRSLDNWELPGFIMPESWRELYTYEEALANIREAAALWIECANDDMRAIPIGASVERVVL